MCVCVFVFVFLDAFRAGSVVEGWWGGEGNDDGWTSAEAILVDASQTKRLCPGPERLLFGLLH